MAITQAFLYSQVFEKNKNSPFYLFFLILINIDISLSLQEIHRYFLFQHLRKINLSPKAQNHVMMKLKTLKKHLLHMSFHGEKKILRKFVMLVIVMQRILARMDQRSVVVCFLT